MANSNQVSLVTGGAGFIGSELIRQLLAKGITVVVYDNFSFGNKANLPEHDNLHVVVGDLNDTDKLRETFNNYSFDTVFHLAALHFIPYCLSHPQETVRVNVEGTLNVLEACKRNQPRAVVYASTAAVYPIKDSPHSESDEPGPIEIYGATKLFGEELLRLFQHETGIKCAAARLFNGYGRRETNPHVIPDILDQVPNGNDIKLGNVEPKRDFVHTSDISRALRRMSGDDGFDFEVFNVGTGNQSSVVEIVNIIAELLGRPLKIVSEESRKRKVERLQLVPDISRIQNKLGWHPRVSLEEGFRDMLESLGLL